MEGITIGQIVHSKAGRDKGRYFIIVGMISDEYVLVADGDLRKITSPKKKKIKHLVFHQKFITSITKELLDKRSVIDADIRKSLQSIGLL